MIPWKSFEKNIIIHGNKMNVIESCLDRHAKSSPDKSAFVFENDKSKQTRITYAELNEQVNKFANLLQKLKVKKNSRIFLFLPKIPELYISFLGTIKQGSIACPLFEAFQTQGLELRLLRGDANVLITNKELYKRFKKIKNIKKKIPSLKHVIVINDNKYKRQIKGCSSEFNCVMRNKYDTCVMIFTSSTAGTPVAGIEIPHYGLIQQHYTAQLVLDLNKEDRYFCTAHPGWVTGSIYGILAPLSIGCSNYIYQGHFDYKKWINFILKNKISIIYTAPTALRMLKDNIKKSDLKYIRNLCSVGEALTSNLFNFYKKLGIEINDTYWQTETGAIVIANYPGLKKKPGSMGKPINIKARLINRMIALKPKWPAIMTGIYKHNKMYKDYFKKAWFRTNDLAKIDKQGYFFFEARKDDIIKTSGERVSPIEIENILIKHKAVKESGVIGIPDKIKGSILKAFIVLNNKFKENEKLKQELSLFVKNNYAGHSYPKEIQFIKELPKTNSGKIIRAKLRNQQ